MFFIIWQGRGYMVPVIGLTTAIIVQAIADFQFGRGYYFAHQWPLAVVAFITGTICWFLGTKWRKEKERVLIDPQTDMPVVIGGIDRFFFIQVQYCGAIIICLLALTLVDNIAKMFLFH